MPIPLIEVELYQGDTWRPPLFTAQSNNGATPPVIAPINFTGCTAAMMIRKTYVPGPVAPLALVTLTTENGGITLGGALGTIDLYVSAAQTLSLPVAVPAGYDPSSGVAPSSIYVADLHVLFPPNNDGSRDRIPYASFLFTLYGTVTR